MAILSSPTSSGRRNSRPPVRVSLACVQCRSKHLRCDALLPVCSRCQSENKQCEYLKSRRGGRRQPGTSQPPAPKPTTTVPQQFPSSGLSSDASRPDSRVDLNPAWVNPESPGLTGKLPAHTDELNAPVVQQLLSLYYSNFHGAHPCVLPKHALKARLEQDGDSLRALYIVMQYIGSLFTPSVSSSQVKVQADQAVAAIRIQDAAITAYDVQAVLLHAIAVYWIDEVEAGRELLDEAIRLALKLGLNRSGFAVENGEQDPVLEECWRRTWWEIFITDGHVAGSIGIYAYRTKDVEMDVHLPCEDVNYESGEIPRPRTLREYEMREFMDDEGQEFSSLAEMVGLARSLARALAPRRNLDLETTNTVCANVDACAKAWFSLLPRSKKGVLRPDGSVDEVLFKANAIIHTYIVILHRQLSTLAYSPIEAVSRCAPPAPPVEEFRWCNAAESQLHTSKILNAIVQFNTLLALPTEISAQTPFMICMIANVVIGHLAACRYVFGDDDLQLCRERIRLGMGALKTYGEIWPLGKRTYQEVGIIAREILALEDRPPRHHVEEQVPNPPLPNPQPTLTAESSLRALIPDNPFDFCDLFDMNFLETMEPIQSIAV